MILLIQFRPCYSQTDGMSIVIDQTILESGLRDYLNLIPKGKEKQYGFNSQEDYAKIHTGNPIYILTTPEDTEERKNGKLKLETLNEWWIPLLIDDQCVSFLFLKNGKSEQKIIGIGYSQLAESLNCCSAYEKEVNKKLGILIIPELEAKFLTKKENNGFVFYPLEATQKNFPTDQKNHLSYGELEDYLISVNYIKFD